MGHQLFRNPPTIREWSEILTLIDKGAGIEQISNLTLRTCETEFHDCRNDRGVQRATYLLLNIPFAVETDDSASQLRDLGIFVTDNGCFFEFLGAVQINLDQLIQHKGPKSDLDEMAQQALIETFAHFNQPEIGEGLFEGIALEGKELSWQERLASFAQPQNFSVLARRFFGRFLFRSLDYFLSRTLYQYRNVTDRFAYLGDERDYTERLEKHCFKCAEILHPFTNEWHFKNGPLNTQKRGNPNPQLKENESETFSQKAVNRFLFETFNKLVDAVTIY